jgi:uncharacterized membrane protein YedE/YeeE
VEHFTPGSAIAGGALIGLSAALLLAAIGRIAGISGMLAGALAPTSDGRGWRITFLAGLVAGTWLTSALAREPILVTMVTGTPGLIVAGTLVGLGTRLANGCTSGHGVCGIARFSVRSMVATATFLLCGALTVFVMRHVMGG